MMKTDVRKVEVTFGDGSTMSFNLTGGGIMTSKTRIKGRVPGNEDALTDVYQVSVHGEVAPSSNDAAESSGLPESNPENDEVANGIDD